MTIHAVAQSLTGSDAIATAQIIADRNGAPVAILEGAVSYLIIEDAEAFEEAITAGWSDYAVVDPQ